MKKKTIKKESSLGKIYKTTDGIFSYEKIKSNKKPRLVIAIEERKDDAALIVTKIHSKNGKEDRIGKDFIPEIVLLPQYHSSLTKESLVAKKPNIAINTKQGKKPIYKGDLNETNDILTKRELKKVKKGIQNDTKKHRKTYKNTVKKWKKHFK